MSHAERSRQGSLDGKEPVDRMVKKEKKPDKSKEEDRRYLAIKVETEGWFVCLLEVERFAIRRPAAVVDD